MSDFDRNPRRQQELRGRPIADAIYKQVFGDPLQITRAERADAAILDIHFAMDVTLRLPSGLILIGQEKFLSYSCARFATLTVEYYQVPWTREEGDWFRLGVQFYFCGYFTVDGKGFDPWVMVNWPSMIVETHKQNITWWQPTDNQRDGARASFVAIPIKSIPERCILAQSVKP